MSLLKHSKNNHQFLAQMEGKINEAEQHKASKSFTVSNQWQALLVLVFRGNYWKLLSIYQTQGVFTQHTVKQLRLNWKYLKYAEHTARREQLEHFFCRFLNTEPISDSLPPHLTMKAVCPSMVFIWLRPNSSRFASFLSFDSNECSRTRETVFLYSPRSTGNRNIIGQIWVTNTEP